MSMFVSGDREKVEKVRELAEKLGLGPLYHDEQMSINSLRAATKTTKKLKGEIKEVVSQVEDTCRRLGRPVRPTELAGNTYRERERVSYILRLAYLRGVVERKDIGRGTRPTYAYLPKNPK